MRATWILFSLVTMAFAGCADDSGGGEECDPESDECTITPPTDVEGPGARVAGQVLDLDGLPIEGAQVALLAPANNSVERSTVTDTNGFFDLGKSPVGSWRLIASRLGFGEMARNVQIEDGVDQTDLVLSLRQIRVQEPFHKPSHALVSLNLSYGYHVGGDFNQGCHLPGATCNAGSIQGNPNTVVNVERYEGIEFTGLMLEETWEANSAICAPTVAIDLYNPDATDRDHEIQNPFLDNPYYWTNYPSDTWGIASPVVMIVVADDPSDPNSMNHPDRLANNGDVPIAAYGNWTVRNFPPGRGFLDSDVADVNCFVDQKIDVYFTAFYGEPVDPRYSARPD